MSRVKCDGGHLPLLAIDECLRMAGATRGDVDHIASIYGHFPERFVTRATHAKELERRLSRALRALTGRSKNTQFSISSLLKERRDRGEAEPGDMSKSFRYREFLSETGFSADARVHFVTGEAEVDKPLAVEGTGHCLQETNAPLTILHQLVVGRQDARDPPLHR